MEDDAPPQNVSSALARELKAPGGLALLFFATALSLVTVFVLPEWKVPAQWPVVIALLWITFVWLSSAALRRVIAESKKVIGELSRLKGTVANPFPEFITAIQLPGQNGEILLLLEANQLFGQSMLVSIYFENQRGVEILLAEGIVSSVQGNGRLQVSVTRWEDAYDDIKRRLLEHDSSVGVSLIVRPAPTTAFIQHNWGVDLLNRTIAASVLEQNYEQ